MTLIGKLLVRLFQNVFPPLLMVEFYGGIINRPIKNQSHQSNPSLCLSQSQMEREIKLIKFWEEPLSATMLKLVLFPTWLVLSKDTFFFQNKENKLKSHKDMVLMLESIMDQSTLFVETQVILNISCQLVIGLLRYGMRISNHQLCKLDITQLT